MARENEQSRSELRSASRDSGRSMGSRVPRSATVSREDIRRIVAKLKEEDTKK